MSTGRNDNKNSGRSKGMAPIKRGKSYNGTSESILPFGVRPNSTDENERLSDYSSQLISGLKPMATRPSDEFFRIEDAALRKYTESPQKAYSSTAGLTPALSQGKLRGATPSREMLSDLVAAADKYGIPRDQFLAIAANESMFGKGYKGGSRRDKNDRGSLQQNVLSAWDVDDQYRPISAARFAYDKKIPGVELVRGKQGYKYEITDMDLFRKSMDEAIQKNPELAEQYRRSNANVRSQGSLNYFDLFADFYNKYGINRLNPGDPEYYKKINEAKSLVSADPVIQQFYKDYDTRSRSNKQIAQNTLRASALSPRGGM